MSPAPPVMMIDFIGELGGGCCGGLVGGDGWVGGCLRR